MEYTQEQLASRGVYLLKFKNGKMYCGCVYSTNESFKSRWDKHLRDAYSNYRAALQKRPLYRAIRRYGWDTIEKIILTIAEGEEYIKSLETAYITSHNLNCSRRKDSMGYNLTDGGDGSVGWCPSKELRAQWSVKRKGKYYRPVKLLTVQNIETKETIVASFTELKTKYGINDTIKISGYSKGLILIDPKPTNPTCRKGSPEWCKARSELLSGVKRPERSIKVTIRNEVTGETKEDMLSNLCDLKLISRCIMEQGRSKGWLLIDPTPSYLTFKKGTPEHRARCREAHKGEKKNYIIQSKETGEVISGGYREICRNHFDIRKLLKSNGENKRWKILNFQEINPNNKEEKTNE